VNSSLPEDFRAEEALLAVALASLDFADRRAKEKVMALPAELFWTPFHREAYEVAQRVFGSTGAVEWQSVTRLMPDHSASLAVLAVAYTDPGMIGFYSDSLRLCHAKRQIYTAGLTTAVNALNLAPEAPDAASLIGSGVEALVSIHSGTAREAVTLRSAFMELIDVFGQPKSLGIQTQFPQINAVTPGIKRQKYWLISGGPSDGKSAFVQNLSSCLIEHKQIHTYYSAELPTEELTQRYMAINCGVSLNVWEKLHHEITPEEQMGMQKAARWDGLDLLHIVDAVGWTPDQVVADMAERAAAGHVAAIIDYLTLLELDYLAPKNREQQVARASQKFQRAFKKLNVTGFVLSQLNDDGQVRESRAPHQDCDVHMRLEKVIGDDGETEVKHQRRLRVMKSRQGKRGDSFMFHFAGEFQKFSPMDWRPEDNQPKQTTKPRRAFKR
jgi:replicative DNA helicase